ncbi:MAG: Methionine aminopeptidase, partial [Parcubacteria group bacterium GW2011_GWA2_56_21]
MIIKNDNERAALIEGGKRLAHILSQLRSRVTPGVSAEELDDLAEQLICEGGDEPCFLGYTPEGANRQYPASLCVSVNDEVVHGIPNESAKML